MKKNLALITIIALLVSLIGCNTDSTLKTGSITVSIKDSISRTITSADSLDAVKYVVEGIGPNNTTVSFELSEGSPTWTNSAAIAGNWNFTATAYNASDKAIGEGSTQATVAPGKSTSVSIQVNEYNGKGILTINLTGISSDLGTLKAHIYKVESGNRVLYSEKDITKGSATFELDNGYYLLTLVCEAGKIEMPAPEAVRIMKGDNLRADYTLNNTDRITAIISNGIKPCPKMSITLNSENVVVGSTVTATATITLGTYRYSWYVDGERLNTANGNSADITFAWGGRHKVTCVAYDTTTAVVWSEDIAIDVSEQQINTVSFYSGNRLIETRKFTPDSNEVFPTLELGEGFTLKGWKAEGSNTLITDESFSLPYSEEEFKYYAYIDTELLRIDGTGAVYATDVLKNSSTITEVAIPDSINGKTVASIGKLSFYSCKNLTSITIPNSVTSIGKSAFNSCYSLTEINIPDSVTSIGNQAFSDCSSITSITIPSSVISIGDFSFSHCNSLTSITIPDSVISIGKFAFDNCTSLTSITIPDSVTSIGIWAFENCTSLTSITIPDSVTSIGEYAFSYCSSLTSVTIPNSVNSIGDGAFSSCGSLTEISVSENNDNYITVSGVLFSKDMKSVYCFPAGKIDTSYIIPISVTNIGEAAFRGCSNLTSITIPNSVTSIGDYAFRNCTNLTSTTIPDSVISIGTLVFDGCARLTNITISSSVPFLEEGVFHDCTSLTSITIPDSVISIGKFAFSGCTSLTSISIPASVTSIGDLAFSYCSTLTSITIPDSVTSIGDDAFSCCTSLTSITIPDSVTFIGDDAFFYCSSLTNINIKQNKQTTSLTGAPWGAYGATITWDYKD